MMENFYFKLETWMNSDDYKWHLNKEKLMESELNTFIAKFSTKKIRTMSIEDYATGRDNKDSFCYWIEQKFDCFGKISGRTNAYQKFVVYWSEDKKEYSFGDARTKHRKGFGSSVEEIYKNVVINLLDLIDGIEVNDYKKISDSPFNPQVKNKISYLYDTEHQMPIYSEDDLNVILTIFDIPFDKYEDRAYKRKKLYDFYKAYGFDEKLSTYMFMSFIYGWYGYRLILRSNEKPIIDVKMVPDYSLVDVQIDSVITTKRTGEGTKRRVVYNPGSEESKRITGRKAEDIVIEYLEKHKKKLDISTINCWCNGEKKDDGRGYDISYIRNDGVEIYIEVKATKTDMKNQVFFELSANEYSVMKAHKDTYYFFFVNDVDSGKIIRRILGNDIYGEEPVKYRIHFESKIKKESGVPNV